MESLPHPHVVARQRGGAIPAVHGILTLSGQINRIVGQHRAAGVYAVIRVTVKSGTVCDGPDAAKSLLEREIGYRG
jgi:hypothetical protein